MRFMIPAAALTAFVTTFAPTIIWAACGDDAATLAQKYGITASLAPNTTASPATTTETLAKSGGVIAPPATGDMAGATVPTPGPSIDKMDTAPALPAQTAEGAPANKTAKSETNAAADAQAASLLQAAREASAHGDEATCKQLLADAKAMLQKTPMQSQ